MIRGLRVDGVGYNVLRVPVALSASAFTPCGRPPALGARAMGLQVRGFAPSEPVFLLDKDYYDRHDERSSGRSVRSLEVHARSHDPRETHSYVRSITHRCDAAKASSFAHQSSAVV